MTARNCCRGTGTTAIASAMLAVAMLFPASPIEARTLAEVRALGTISICANPQALPYSSQKGDQPGFQIEIARLIAEGLDLSLGTEWIVPRRRAHVVNCDMLLDKPSDPKVTEGKLLLSRPYHRSGVALGLAADAQLVNDYSELEKGQKIGVMISSQASMILGKAGKTTSPYAFQSDMLEDLEKGDLYGIAISSAAMSHYISKHPTSGLKIAYAFESEPELTWNVSVGLRNADEQLLDAVNSVLERLIADGTIAAIYRKYGVEHRLP
jgi:polar amino acid transport system substrate-binding protein